MIEFKHEERVEDLTLRITEAAESEASSRYYYWLGRDDSWICIAWGRRIQTPPYDGEVLKLYDRLIEAWGSTWERLSGMSEIEHSALATEYLGVITAMPEGVARQVMKMSREQIASMMKQRLRYIELRERTAPNAPWN